MKRYVLALIVAVLSMAGAATAGSRPAQALSNILWRDCRGGAQCGTMQVPLDHRKPGDQQIQLALIRLPALDPSRREGVLFVNPGGPGGSGIELARNAGSVFGFDILERFDIIGFDPRGVGSSTAIDCVDTLDLIDSLDPTPNTPLEKQKIIDAATAFGADCQRRSRSLIQHVDSESVARDMDLIRAALGEEKISYFGFSYGTFIGAIYADLFPGRLRAAVLDGALDPSLTPDEVLVQGAQGFEHALDAFLADCATRTQCPFKAPDGDLKKAYDDVIARLDASPLTDGPVPLDGDLVIRATRGSMYSPRLGWPLLAEALRQAENGSSTGFLLILGVLNSGPPPTPQQLTNPEESFLAIACADIYTVTSLDDWHRLYSEAVAAAPHFGAGDATFSVLPCAVWPRVDRRVAAAVHAAGAPPIVVVGTTNDPATPYAWAQRMASNLDSATLLTYHGEGHTAYGGESRCINSAVDAYLVSLTVPAAGTVCEPDGQIPAYRPEPASRPVAPVSDGPLPALSPLPVGISLPDAGAGRPRAADGAIEWLAAALIVAGMGALAAVRLSRSR